MQDRAAMHGSRERSMQGNFRDDNTDNTVTGRCRELTIGGEAGSDIRQVGAKKLGILRWQQRSLQSGTGGVLPQQQHVAGVHLKGRRKKRS